MNRYVLDARTATNHFPGIGRYVSNVARAMVNQLARTETLILLYNPAAPSRWTLPTENRQVKRVAVAASPFSLPQQWQVPRLLSQLEATVYHSPYYLMPYRPGIPTLVTIYDFIPQLYPDSVSLQARLLFGLTTRLALRTASHITTISASSGRDLQALYHTPSSHITPIPLAPDPRLRPQPPAEINRVRQQYNLPPDYVLYFGINKPHKNLLRLLQAWQILLRQLESPPLLVIAGAWDTRYPDAQDFVEQEKLTQAVRFLGPIPEAEVAGLMSGACLFAFPSVYEGFGLPVIEAMACGTPVVCGNASSLPEVAGEAALLFDPTRPDTIAHTLYQVLTDTTQRERMRQAGLAQAQQFSWQTTAQATLALYRQLAQG